MEASLPTIPVTEPVPTPRGLTIRQSWYLIFILFLWQFAAAVPYGVIEVIGQKTGFSVPKGVLLSGMYALAFGLTVWGALRKRKDRRLSFTAIKPAVYPVIAVGVVAFGILLEPLTSLLPVPAWLQKMLEQTFTKDAIWSAVLLAPVLEEILFRGIMLDGLLKRYSPAKAIIWSAVLFGIVHLNPAQSVGAFALGLPLGWLYYRTGSLLPCIALHFVNNAIGSLPLLTNDSLNMSDNTTRSFIANDGLYAGLLLLAALICFVCYRTLNQLLPKPVSQVV